MPSNHAAEHFASGSGQREKVSLGAAGDLKILHITLYQLALKLSAIARAIAKLVVVVGRFPVTNTPSKHDLDNSWWHLLEHLRLLGHLRLDNLRLLRSVLLRYHCWSLVCHHCC